VSTAIACRLPEDGATLARTGIRAEMYLGNPRTMSAAAQIGRPARVALPRSSKADEKERASPDKDLIRGAEIAG